MRRYVVLAHSTEPTPDGLYAYLWRTEDVAIADADPDEWGDQA